MVEFPYVPLTATTMPVGSPSGGSAPRVALDTAPYPEVEGAPDPEDVALIKENRSSAGGELTAVLQYVYQNNLLTNNDAVANALLQIALVEMMHLDLLGDAIQALGGKPTYDDGKYYWQAGAVNSADNLADMMKGDIAAEENAIAVYEASIGKTSNESLKALFRRIIEDEKLHLAFFKQLLQEIER